MEPRGGITQALEETLRDQVRELVLQGKVLDALPHTSVWLHCKRIQGSSEIRPLPEPGGVLDQTYELVWAFGILDDQYDQEIEAKRSLEDQKKNYQQLKAQLMAQ